MQTALRRLAPGRVAVTYHCDVHYWRIVMLSARNQFTGTVKELKLGTVMAEVVVSAGGIEIAAAITRNSAETLNLKEGDQVTAVIKATDVMINK
jgi:molybdopterin-binding protein